MEQDLPYVIFVNFITSFTEKELFVIMKTVNLNLVSEEIDDNGSKNLKFYLHEDSNNSIAIHFEIDTNQNFVENISILISLNTEIHIIKQLFLFLEKFDSQTIEIIDQEIMNFQFLENMANIKSNLIDITWSNEAHNQSILSTNFLDFLENPKKIIKRDILLGISR